MLRLESQGGQASTRSTFGPQRASTFTPRPVLGSGGGGGYWDQRLNGGRGGWVPVNDPRLEIPPLSVRFGVEFGM
jgi:hypothetical protein